MNPYTYEELARERQEEIRRQTEYTGLVTANPLPALWGVLRPVGELAWSVVRGIRPRWWSEQPVAKSFDERESASDAA
jgi:hypothetical protein